jgi:diguanylate cyclase (GGDEF)-like protein
MKAGNYLGACLIHVDGIVLASTRDPTIGETVKSLHLRSDRLADAFAGKTVFVPPVWRETGNGQPNRLAMSASPVLLILTPIAGEGKPPVAVLALNVKLSEHFTELIHAGRFGKSAEVYAFDKNARLLTNTRFDDLLVGARGGAGFGASVLGLVLREPPRELSAEEVFNADLAPWPLTRMVTQAMQRTRGTDVQGYRGALGRTVLGAWSWNDDLEIGIGAELDEVEALARVRLSRGLAWGLWGTFSLLSLGFSLWLATLRKRLQRAVSSVATVTERRVSERTEELTKQNEELRKKIEEHRVVEASLRIAQQSLEETSERFARLSQLDALTNLANRRRFDEFLEREWRRCIRYNKPISLVLIDIDYFRLFNDAYGHGAGDDCLREIAGVIMNAARRPDDLAARLGGEEFALVLCDTDAEGARAIAHHVRLSIENLAIDHEMTMVTDADSVTVSLGVATKLPEPNSGPSTLLYHADEALFLAKQEGRNCVRSYDDYTAQSPSTASVRAATSSIWPQQVLGRKP